MFVLAPWVAGLLACIALAVFSPLVAGWVAEFTGWGRCVAVDVLPRVGGIVGTLWFISGGILVALSIPDPKPKPRQPKPKDLKNLGTSFVLGLVF